LSVAVCGILWGVGVVVHLYLAGLPALPGVHHRASLLLVAQGCAAAACLSADLILLFFLLELIVVCLWLLLRLDDQGAANGMLASAHVGGLLFLGGALLVWGQAGDTSLSALPLLLVAGNSSSLRAMALLLVLGLLPKVAAVPGHGWLPDAVRGTPAAALAPALVLPFTAGVALVRLLPGSFALGVLPSVSLLMITLGLLSLWLGAVRVWLAKGLLEFAAWLTIAQAGIGLVALGAGIAPGRSPAMSQAVTLHLLAAFAGLCAVWVGASAVRARMGTEVIEDLGGVLKAAPLALIALFAGGLSCLGLPLLPGSWSQRLLLEGIIAQERTWLVVAVVAGDVVLLAALLNVLRRVLPARAPQTPPGWQSPWLSAALTVAIMGLALMAVTSTAWFEWSRVVANSVLSISQNTAPVSP
ncbi:MAG: hypothetical protein JXA57_15090, partial [Armatimonadetes bacterium]|nr:hypothetical protein [Armatimonadota bacterium]